MRWRAALGEVVIEHVPVGLPPATARVLEVAYQFLLLGIHTDDRQSVREIPPADTGQVAELPVPVRVVRPGRTFPVGPQRVVVLVEQPGDALSTDGDPLTPEGGTELPGRFMRPLQGRHRVACGRILEQLVPRSHEVGEFFFRPACGPRLASECGRCRCPPVAGIPCSSRFSGRGADVYMSPAAARLSWRARQSS